MLSCDKQDAHGEVYEAVIIKCKICSFASDPPDSSKTSLAIASNEELTEGNASLPCDDSKFLGNTTCGSLEEDPCGSWLLPFFALSCLFLAEVSEALPLRGMPSAEDGSCHLSAEAATAAPDSAPPFMLTTPLLGGSASAL